MSRETFRNRVYFWVLTAFGALLLPATLAFLVVILFGPPPVWLPSSGGSAFLFRVTGTGVILTLVVFWCRCILSGVWIDTSIVKIRTPWRTHRIPIQEVERFSLGPWKLMLDTCLIHLSDGRVMHVYGVEGFPRSRSAVGLVARMNERLTQADGRAREWSDERSPLRSWDEIRRATPPDPRVRIMAINVIVAGVVSVGFGVLWEWPHGEAGLVILTGVFGLMMGAGLGYDYHRAGRHGTTVRFPDGYGTLGSLALVLCCAVSGFVAVYLGVTAENLLLTLLFLVYGVLFGSIIVRIVINRMRASGGGS